MKTSSQLIIALSAVLVMLSCTEKPTPDNGGGQKTDEEQTSSVPTFTSKIYKQNSEGYPIFRIPAMVTTKKGTLLCFCEGREAYDDFGNIDVVVKRSEDMGKTWSPLTVVADAGNDRYGNPVPVVLDDGKILLVFGWSVHDSSMSSKILYTFSEDDGKTWSTPVEFTDQVRLSTRSIYMSGPVHGIVKQLEPHKGRIIIPLYGKTTNSRPVSVLYSDNGGTTWHHGGSVNYSIGGEPTVAERGDGSIMINMRDGNADDPFRHQALSQDGGETWLDPTSSALIEPACQGALLTYDLGSAANKTVLLFSNPNHTSSRRHGSVKISTNGGNSWKYMYQYTSDTGDSMYSSYSDISVVKDDVIGVAFEAGYKNGQGISFKSFHLSDIKEIYTGKNKE